MWYWFLGTTRSILILRIPGAISFIFRKPRPKTEPWKRSAAPNPTHLPKQADWLTIFSLNLNGTRLHPNKCYLIFFILYLYNRLYFIFHLNVWNITFTRTSFTIMFYLAGDGTNTRTLLVDVLCTLQSMLDEQSTGKAAFIPNLCRCNCVGVQNS